MADAETHKDKSMSKMHGGFRATPTNMIPKGQGSCFVEEGGLEGGGGGRVGECKNAGCGRRGVECDICGA